MTLTRRDFDWPDVRTALARFGVEFHRISRRERRMIYRFPTGEKVSLGPENGHTSRYGMKATPGALGEVFKVAAKVGIDRDTLMQALEEAKNPPRQKGTKPMPETERVRVQQPVAPQFDLRIRDVLDQAGIGSDDQALRNHVSTQLSKNADEVAGPAHVKIVQFRQRNERRFDPTGAAMLAKFAKDKAAEYRERAAVPAPSTPVAVAPSPAVTEKAPPAVPVVTPSPSPAIEENLPIAAPALEAAPRPPLTVGQALLALCTSTGVAPEWKDGLTLDLEATVIALGESMR